MGAKVFVVAIENGQLQGIDDTADSIDDTSGKQPVKGPRRKRVNELSKGEYAGPAHSYIDDGGEPFWTGYPKAGH